MTILTVDTKLNRTCSVIQVHYSHVLPGRVKSFVLWYNHMLLLMLHKAVGIFYDLTVPFLAADTD